MQIWSALLFAVYQIVSDTVNWIPNMFDFTTSSHNYLYFVLTLLFVFTFPSLSRWFHGVIDLQRIPWISCMRFIKRQIHMFLLTSYWVVYFVHTLKWVKRIFYFINSYSRYTINLIWFVELLGNIYKEVIVS